MAQRSGRWTPVTLLDHAQLNPSVAGALAHVAPILANTTRASGEFSLVIDEARWIAGEEKRQRLTEILRCMRWTLALGQWWQKSLLPCLDNSRYHPRYG